MDEDLTELNGKVTYIKFQNENNFYTVAQFVINDENQKHITITGILPDIQKDVLYNIFGHYEDNPRYGMQFKVQTYEKPLPSEEEGVIRYLSGPQFNGIGRKTAEKIITSLGENCLKQIREDPEILKTVPGLSLKNIEAIQAGIKQEDSGMEELVRFLNIHGIGTRNLVRLNKAYGSNALEKLKENPYRVIEECEGFGFATADKIGKALNFNEDDPRRLYALLVSLTMDLCMKEGDSYISITVLKEEFLKKIHGMNADFDSLIEKAQVRHSLMIEEDRVYPVSQYEAEDTISTFFAGYPYQTLAPYEDKLLDQYCQALEKDIGITYDEDQMKAIHCFFSNPFMIMTGGPGTGKTTVVKAFVSLFHMLYPESKIICSAPTGRAAKRLAELTDTTASTIHSLLQWDLETNTFGKNEDNPIDADLLIIDEFSMVDAYLFSSLLKAARNVKKICIIGDEDQLPSVGPGSVLRDLIASKAFPLIRLEHIYRQKSQSEVIQLARNIREGKCNFEDYHRDVRFFSCEAGDIRRCILQIVQSAFDKGYSFDDIQVLSPMYNGPAGIDALNNSLQSAFNPPSDDKKEVRSGYRILREGDRILQMKNQPDEQVFNGDIGTLEEIIDAKEAEDHKTTIVVNFQDNYVEYKPDNWLNITLAYCISVHKAQGNEYPIVIMPIVRQHTIMLQRKLIYTGVTRAKKALILLGSKEVFEKGIQSSERHVRQTTLKEKIIEKMEKVKA